VQDYRRYLVVPKQKKGTQRTLRHNNNNKSGLTVAPCIVAAADVVELNVWERGARPYPGLGTWRSALTTGQSRCRWCSSDVDDVQDAYVRVRVGWWLVWMGGC